DETHEAGEERLRELTAVAGQAEMNEALCQIHGHDLSALEEDLRPGGSAAFARRDHSTGLVDIVVEFALRWPRHRLAAVSLERPGSGETAGDLARSGHLGDDASGIRQPEEPS